MRTFLTTSLSFSVLCLFANPPHANNTKVAESILTRHSWTLMEITQKEKDTLTNLTLFLTPCEKDNFVSYSGNGTYQIHEGSDKCSTTNTDVKGEGTWTFNTTDSTILDSYQGGRKVSKKLLSLSDEVMKIQYYGEAQKQFTLTYFSEEGKKDEANKDLIFDNSDASQNVAQTIRNYLQSTDYYIVTSAKDFQDGRRSNADDKKGLKPTVFIMPFTNTSKDPVNTTERNEQLIAQAKKSDIDYVITGDLKSVDSKADDQKNYTATVKYDLYVLDVANGATFSQPVSNGKEEEAKVEKKGLSLGKLAVVGKKLLVVAGNVAGAVFLSRYYSNYYYHGYVYNRNYVNTYNTLFRANQALNAASATASVFNDGNNTVRTDTYNKNNATLAAVSETTDKTIEFVAENTAPRIKINSVDGDGKKARLVIEAGSNIGLLEGDELSVMKMVGTGDLRYRKEIGEIKIEKIIQIGAASCTLEDNRDDILKAYKETPGDIVIMPKLKEKNDKKS